MGFEIISWLLEKQDSETWVEEQVSLQNVQQTGFGFVLKGALRHWVKQQRRVPFKLFLWQLRTRQNI